MFGFESKRKKSFRGLLFLVSFFFVILILIISSYFFLEVQYQNKIYPNVRLGEFNLGDKTVEDARTFINQKSGFLNQGIKFFYADKELTINPSTSFNNEEDFNVDINETIYQAFNFGRDSNFIINYTDRVSTFLFGKQIDLVFQLNKEKLTKELKKEFAEFENEMEEASLFLKNNDFIIKAGSEGKEFDYDRANNLFEENLKQVKDDPIELILTIREPITLIEDIDAVNNQAKDILKLTPIKLMYGKNIWSIDEKKIVNWLELGSNEDEEISVVINKEKIKEFLETGIAPKINRAAVDAKFELKNNRVTTWNASEIGLNLDIDKNIENIIKEINNNINEIELVVGETMSLTKSSKEAEELGLKEIIGIGTSDFTGSPSNRRHNIRIGATQLNGLLIKPDEEFSLIKVLGIIDETTGYLPELVIKDNETIPEYGGGLCQIATTLFRAVLKTGLDITLRRNHSYRVSYYEPAGTDATIYDPWPDFRFINDTGKTVMLQTVMEGNILTFTFWGTNDGRIIEMTEPTIYNIVKPEPTRIIETIELPVGEEKCTESAHNGADAYFDYKITNKDGEVEEERYESHYTPWQAVCMIGVESLEKELEKELEEKKTGIGASKWGKTGLSEVE